MTDASFVRKEFTPEQPAPVSEHGVVGWMLKNLFSSPFNIVLTLVGAFLLYSILRPLIEFAFINAIWDGTNGEWCRTEEQSNGLLPTGTEVGACWAMVKVKFNQYIYFQYPVAERWRVDLVLLSGLAMLVPLLIPSVPLKTLNTVLVLFVYPIAAFVLLTGGNLDVNGFFGLGEALRGTDDAFAFIIDWVLLSVILAGIVMALSLSFGGGRGSGLAVAGIMAAIGGAIAATGIDFGLPVVETPLWGGLLVTLVIAVTGITASMPLGIVLALGRRSKMPLVRTVSVGFIEFWRGIPLITVLFMSSVMLPLFLPEGITFNKLLRALIGVSLFSSAYIAETVRGGLQAIPKGQYEGSQALGLSYWKTMNLIVLPQAIKHVIPGIVNSFIGLFKDTTLVLIIGMFDLLGAIQTSFTDPNWSSPVQSHTGYMFAAAIFWVFCFAMSRYSMFMENKLHTGHKR